MKSSNFSKKYKNKKLKEALKKPLFFMNIFLNVAVWLSSLFSLCSKKLVTQQIQKERIMKTEKLIYMQFEISYDGIYKIIVDELKLNIYLSPLMLLTLFEREGYGINEIKKFENEFSRIPFKNTSISLFRYVNNDTIVGWISSQKENQYEDNKIYFAKVEFS